MMKTIYKILLVPVVIVVAFAVFCLVFWGIGSLIILMGVDFLPHYGDTYTFSEIAIVGFWHSACLYVLYLLSLLAYLVIDLLFD